MKKVILFAMLFASVFIAGCAAGSATAGYSVRAKTAEELSPDAEDRLVTKIKEDMKLWLDAELAKDEKNRDMSGVRAERQQISCANCSEKIGALEKRFTYEGHIVCARCYEKLNNSP